MKKLQPREKVMLIVLILVAIVLLPGYFLISPLLQANSDLETQLNDLSIQRQDLEIATLSNADLEETIESLQLKLSNEEQLVPTRLKSYDIHYTVEDICKQNDVTLKSMNISEYEPVIVNNDNGEPVQQAEIVYKSKLSVSFSSDNMDAVIDTLDALGKNEYALLTACTVSIPESRQSLPAQLAEDTTVAEKSADTSTQTEADEPEPSVQESAAPAPVINEQMIECSVTLDIYAVLQPDDPEFSEAVQAAGALQAETEETAEEAA